MDDIHIDRLTLQLSGLTEAEGRDLAARITEGLAAAEIPANAATAQGAIRVDLGAAPSEAVDELSARIVAEVLRQLNRVS